MTEGHLKEMFKEAATEAPGDPFDLDRAIRSGARRRRGRKSLYWVGAAALVSVVTAGAVALTAPSPSTREANSASQEPTTPVPTLADLEALARTVAGPDVTAEASYSDRKVQPGDTESGNVLLQVTTASGGTYDIATGISRDPDNNVARWAQACMVINDGRTGGACSPLVLTSNRGIWANSYADQPGRETLRLVTTLPGGVTVVIGVDNYTKRPDGSTAIGPSWQDVGITAKSLEQKIDAALG